MNKIKEFKINEIPLRYRVCFFASLIWGLLAHGFMLANKLSYHDDINNFGVGATFHFGRWMLSVFGVSSRVLFGTSNFSLPWFSGIVCILVLAFAACYIIKIFDIKKPVFCVALAGVIVAFPSITAVFGFMFFGIHYCIDVFFTVLSVYFFSRKKNLTDFLFGGIFFTWAIGIYQSLISFELTLLILVMIKRSLDEERTFKEFFKEGLYYVGCCILSLIAYLLITKITCAVMNEPLADYKGISNFGVTSVSGYISRVARAYKVSLLIALDSHSNVFPTYTMKIIWWLLLIFEFVYLIYDSIKRKSVSNLIQKLILFLLLPLGLGFTYVMSESVSVLQMFSETVPFILCAIIAEKYICSENNKVKILTVSASIVLLFSGIYYARFANICYFKLDFQQQQAIGYYTNMITRIQSLEGYSDELPVAVLNIENISDKNISYVKQYDFVTVIPYNDSQEQFLSNYKWDDFMKMWCGYEPDYIEDTTEVENNPIVKDMPHYPDYGSVRIVDGVIVVKF